jgi:hypothetical protein
VNGPRSLIAFENKNNRRQGVLRYTDLHATSGDQILAAKHTCSGQNSVPLLPKPSDTPATFPTVADPEHAVGDKSLYTVAWQGLIINDK